MAPADAELIDIARPLVGRMKLATHSEAGTVACALRTSSGRIATGICIDMPCGIGFCAEHAAVAELLKSRETVITSIVAVSAGKILPPCGRCRELLVLVDQRNFSTLVTISPDRAVPLRDLLPEHWLALP
jgi:cytidine deaminase